MSPFSCTREPEVRMLLERGQWPLAFSVELRAHVAACRSCGEIILVKQAFQSARTTSMAVPVLPSAGALWWRAQLRRRNAAIERIGKPILGAQIFALGMILVLGAAALAWQLRRGLEFVGWMEALPRSLHLDALLPASLTGLNGSFWFLLPLLAVLALVSGVVVYFASEKH
jgi:hypothetical protein